MKNFQPPELLCPAGDMERLEAALLFGADAVYLGGQQLGMRASPANFTPEQLAQAVQLAHSKGAKVYYTCNALPTNQEADILPTLLPQLAETGIDALIVADVGLLMLARRLLPQIELHISTQAGVTNYLAACELHALGASRVVLARELSLQEIAEIRYKTPPALVLEAFAHGAMCLSFSGRCLLSQYMVGRDANRGECAQPCRWRYHLVEEKRPGEYYPIYEEGDSSYILNAKDLCTIERINKLAEAGISSLKIEGRAKSAYYVAAIANAYRQALDLYAQNPTGFVCPPWLVEETKKVSHRQYTSGFYFGPPQEGQFYESGGYIREWEVVAVVEDWRDGMLHCSQRNRFFAGDMLEAMPPNAKPFALQAQPLLDGEGNPIASAPHPTMPLQIPLAQPLPKGTILRKQVGEGA